MKMGRPSCRQAQRAFTMIEIAIAVGVIGFALVAIIGLLPRGMGVQKENREDTIVSQDAPYFLNAIRNGEMRTNNNVLTSYVESVTVVGSNLAGGWSNVYYNPSLTSVGNYNYLTNDMNIVGLLSTPEIDAYRLPPGTTNQVTALVYAMSGSALNQNSANSLTAFRYQLTVEIDPWNYNNLPYFPSDVPVNSAAAVAYATNYMNYLETGLHEVRLKFVWPVLPGPNNTYTIPANHQTQTYRTLVGSHLLLTNVPGTIISSPPPNSLPDNIWLWFFEPQSYTTNFTNF